MQRKQQNYTWRFVCIDFIKGVKINYDISFNLRDTSFFFSVSQIEWNIIFYFYAFDKVSTDETLGPFYGVIAYVLV